MTDPRLPRILDSRWRAPGETFKIQELELEFSNGERRTYQRMNPRGLGAVIIVPMRDKETVLLAREYAAGLHQYELGLPKGRLDNGESVLEGAQREMKEEIGFGANDFFRVRLSDVRLYGRALDAVQIGRLAEAP